MKLKLPIVSFDDDDIDLMVEKMDLNGNNRITMAELLELIGLLNLDQFKEEIKFMFEDFSNSTENGERASQLAPISRPSRGSTGLRAL